MVRHNSLAVRVALGRLSRCRTTWITSLEMTSVAGVSGAVCAVCRNQSSRMAVGVRMASRLHMASTVCKERSSNKQPVLRTLWKSSTNHLHLYHVTRCHASSVVLTVMEATKIHSNASTPSGGSGSHTRTREAFTCVVCTAVPSRGGWFATCDQLVMTKQSP